VEKEWESIVGFTWRRKRRKGSLESANQAFSIHLKTDSGEKQGQATFSGEQCQFILRVASNGRPGGEKAAVCVGARPLWVPITGRSRGTAPTAQDTKTRSPARLRQQRSPLTLRSAGSF
jgi:hypothetical protein